LDQQEPPGPEGNAPPPAAGQEEDRLGLAAQRGRRDAGRGRELLPEVEVLGALEAVDVGETEEAVLHEAQADLGDAEAAEVSRDFILPPPIRRVQPERAGRCPGHGMAGLELQPPRGVREVRDPLAGHVYRVELVERLVAGPERPGRAQREERTAQLRLDVVAVAAISEGEQRAHARAAQPRVAEGDVGLVAVQARPPGELELLAAAQEVPLGEADGPDVAVADLGEPEAWNRGPGVERRDAHINRVGPPARRGPGLDPRVAEEAEPPQIALGLRQRFVVGAIAGAREQLAPDHRLAGEDVRAVGQAVRPRAPPLLLDHPLPADPTPYHHPPP